MLSRETVLQALENVTEPLSGRDVVSVGLVTGVAIEDGKVGLVLTIDPEQKERLLPLRAQCENAVSKLPGVTSVSAVMTAQNPTPIPPKPESGYDAPRERAQWNLTPLDYVGRVIAVASGKGGVGKSTTTANLARVLTAQGHRTGILDADIYGPSVPRIMGLRDAGQPKVEDGKMLPPTASDIACMSMGFITGNAAAILRGPMITKALQQMLRLTRWGTKEKPLHTLLVDMPPGTGDVHLSLVQQVPLAGVIIVTTPQDVATEDARKCAEMFVKTNVPILGVIENMSWFEDAAGHRHALFGEGGGAQLAKAFSVPLLGQVPINPTLREAADHGKPPIAKALSAYEAIVSKLGA